MKRGLASLVLVAIAAGCGGARPAPHFEDSHGWHRIVESGRTVSAANVPFAAADRAESVPARTIASLRPRGVVIWVEWVRRGVFPAADRSYPELRFPLRLADAAHSGTPEGTSSPGAVRRLQVRDSGRGDTVWIFFGTERPSAAQLRTTDAELSRLSL